MSDLYCGYRFNYVATLLPMPMRGGALTKRSRPLTAGEPGA